MIRGNTQNRNKTTGFFFDKTKPKIIWNDLQKVAVKFVDNYIKRMNIDLDAGISKGKDNYMITIINSDHQLVEYLKKKNIGSVHHYSIRLYDNDLSPLTGGCGYDISYNDLIPSDHPYHKTSDINCQKECVEEITRTLTTIYGITLANE